METNDLTLEVLKDIRAEARKTNERITQTNQRLEEVSLKLGERIDDLSRRVVESEMRTATAITALSGDVRNLTEFLRETQDLRPRVTQCEDDIRSLKRRLG